MKKKEEIRQLDKLWKKAKKHFQNFLKSKDQEDLHQFRVRVKKLKAMLTFYAAAHNNQKLLHYFKPVKKVFAKAGDIRNAYINLKLNDEYQLNNKDFKQQQQHLLTNIINRFKKRSNKHLQVIKKAHFTLQNNIDHVKSRTILNFYQEKLAAVESFFDQPTMDNELHNTRKKIKLLLYNRNLAVHAISRKLIINFDYLDNLQNVIGDWHDHNLTLQVFSNLKKPEVKAMDNLQKSNANLERIIMEQGADFRSKVGAAEQESENK